MKAIKKLVFFLIAFISAAIRLKLKGEGILIFLVKI